MASIEKRLYKAWKERRGMRLSAEEVELLMHRGLQYLQAEERAIEADCGEFATAPDPRQIDSSRVPPKRGPVVRELNAAKTAGRAPAAEPGK